jgi:hypothetical protein
VWGQRIGRERVNARKCSEGVCAKRETRGTSYDISRWVEKRGAEAGETHDLVTAAPGAPGGASGGGPQDGGWSRRHLISCLLARRPKGEGAQPITPRANGLPCLNSGGSRISRGWCAWNSTPRRFRHTTHTHMHTCTRCALGLAVAVAVLHGGCSLACAVLRCPALSCLVLRSPAWSCPVAALSRLSSSPRPRLQPASHTRRAITIFAGGDSSAVIGSSRSLPVAEDTGGSSLY